MTKTHEHTNIMIESHKENEVSRPQPIAGELYMVNCRFGRATVLVNRVDETWAHCEVRSGKLQGIGRGAIWKSGDLKSLRIESSFWTPVK